MKKKLFIIIGIILIIGVVVFFGFKIVNKVMFNIGFNDMIKTAKENGETHIFIEINPKLVLVVDENDKVKEISPANVDAIVITEQDFSDLDLESVINKIIEIAKENNYLNDKKEISITTLTEDNGYIDKVKQYIVNNDKDIKVSEINKSTKEIYEDIMKDQNVVIEEIIRNFQKESEEQQKASEEEQKKIKEEYEKQQEKWNARVKKCLPIIEAKGFVYKNNSFPCCDGTNLEGGCYSCNPTEEGARYCHMVALYTDENGVVVEEEEVCLQLYNVFDNYCEE